MSCEACGGTGWSLKTADGLEMVERCPECSRQNRISRRLTNAQIPPRYIDRGFDVYSAHNPSQEAALKKAIDFVDRFPRSERGLLLSGPCGVGKTHLAAAIIKSIVEEKMISARFVDEADLLRRLQYSYGPDSPATEREVMIPLMEYDLLIWDDLGTGRPTEWVKETIRMVINHRYTYRKHTIMTTNWPLRTATGRGDWGTQRSEQTLEERLGTRLYSRIMEMCEVIEVEGPDFRQEIHKAGMDFQTKARGEAKNRTSSRAKRSSSSSALRVPSSLLACPRCDSKSVSVLDQGELKKSPAGQMVELACHCGSCAEHFFCRFYPQSARVEYPSM